MRNFVISLIIIIAAALYSYINACYIESTLGDIIYNIKEDIHDPRDIDKILSRWDELKPVLCLCVKREHIRQADDAFLRADTAAKKKDEYEYAAACSSIIYKLEEIITSQGLHVNSLF